MAKQSQKCKDKNTEILHVINKYVQILRSRRKRVEMLLKRRVLRLFLKLSNEGLPLTLLPLSLTFREFNNILYSILPSTGNQCSSLRTGVICSLGAVLVTIREVEF